MPQLGHSSREQKVIPVTTHALDARRRAKCTKIKDLEIDMVKQITLDYMQVVCIGVTRTLLNAWTHQHRGK